MGDTWSHIVYDSSQEMIYADGAGFGQHSGIDSTCLETPVSTLGRVAGCGHPSEAIYSDKFSLINASLK